MWNVLLNALQELFDPATTPKKESITNLSSPALETEVSVIKNPTAEEEHLNL